MEIDNCAPRSLNLNLHDQQKFDVLNSSITKIDRDGLWSTKNIHLTDQLIFNNYINNFSLDIYNEQKI